MHLNPEEFRRGPSKLANFIQSGGGDNYTQQLIKLIEDEKIDVDAYGNSGTPLYHAAFNKNTELVTALMNRGADINKPCALGRTPLHVGILIAVATNSEALVATLLKSKEVKFDRQDITKGKFTPLDFAFDRTHFCPSEENSLEVFAYSSMDIIQQCLKHPNVSTYPNYIDYILKRIMQEEPSSTSSNRVLCKDHCEKLLSCVDLDALDLEKAIPLFEHLLRYDDDELLIHAVENGLRIQFALPNQKSSVDCYLEAATDYYQNPIQAQSVIDTLVGVQDSLKQQSNWLPHFNYW